MKPNKDIEERLFGRLGTFQSIDAEADWQKVRERMDIKNQRSIRPVWQIAAAVILLLGIGFLAQKYLDLTPEAILVEAGNQIQDITLPDGSLVTLNKQASLIYPEKFGRRQRGIELVGEAFFDVVRDPSKVFVVVVDQKALVRVLGTSFNIRPDDSNKSISVQVIEGRVAFSSVLAGSEELVLEKDQQATMSQGIILRDDVPDRNFLSWKTGKLFFDHESIGAVVRQLQAHYHVEIVLHESVPEDLYFTSTIDNQELESVLDEISLVLGLEYVHEDDKIVFTKP